MKHQVHNLIILDESGSMESIKKTIIQGFNEIAQTIHGIEKQYPDQEHFITFVSFNGLGQKTHLEVAPASKLEFIDEKKYQPDASTPLYDAMGTSMSRLRKALLEIKDYNVLVTILTDGEENASQEYTGASIKALVEELKEKRWTFTYIGADHDVEKFATSLSINNSMTFEKNEDDMKRMFSSHRAAQQSYSKKISNKEDVSEGFYENLDPDKEKSI